ncbi:hypothetical protein SAMN05216368_10942 [Cryobacterium flavum]|uniref:Uncharacterized protein n=1 Tax=Cryobacterium flavum TaxID=1424659 RepID=A0A5E9G1Q9_9MICO|nr:hypothetical protein [Cryobacterium flavum]SDO01231.1 hypothetical protein SAMN05216368_10942 [Cryobacterium flavum]
MNPKNSDSSWTWRRVRAAFGVRENAPHTPSLKSASVHFLLTASLRGDPNLARSVRKLLDAELAVSAAWPSETAIRVSHRLRKEARQLKSVRAMAMLHERADVTGSWRSALAFALRFPRLGIQYLHAKWVTTKISPRFKKFAESPSEGRLLVLLALHPFFTIRRVLPSIRFTWNKKRGDPVEGRHEGSVEQAAEGAEIDDDKSSFLDVLAEAERLYLDRQVVSVAIRLSDARLFGGPDRDEDGFVRLMLRESYHDFVLPGSEEQHHVVFEPRLLLHESGVVQLDLVLSAQTTLDVRQALAMMWGPEELFLRSQMSKPLLRGTQWEQVADYSSGEVDAGQPLGTIEHPTPISMAQLLEIHLSAVLAIIKRSYRHWVIYPFAILDADECCNPEEWKQTHRDDLIRLAIRGSVEREVAPHVAIPRDLSLGRDRSLYAGLGSAVHFQWRGAAPRGVAELDTVLVLEYALLQYMRLHTMEEHVSQMALGERSMRARYRGAVRIFSELRQRDLRSGEARDVVRHVLQEFGVPDIRRTIETALNLSASAYATLSAERASRRAWWVTSAATLIALLVAVPPLRELLNSVPASEPGETWALVPFRWLADRGFWGPWFTMAGVLLLVIAIWILDVSWRWRVRRLPSFRRGYKWPNEFTVDRELHSPSALGPRSTNLHVSLPGGAKDTGGSS